MRYLKIAKLLFLIVGSLGNPLLFLAVGCSGTQSPAVAAFIQRARVIGHAAAVGFCAVHQIGTPLIIAAEGAYPLLRVVAPVADAFCAAVDREEAVLHQGGPGQTVTAPPTYLVSEQAFAVTR